MPLAVDSMDRKEWDAFVSRSPQGHFMQSHAWGELQRAAGWRPHYVSLADGTSVRAAALLLSRSLPLTGRRVFYAPRGPVAAAGDTAAYRELAPLLRDYVRRERGAFLRVDPYLREGAPEEGLLVESGFRRVTRDWSYWNAPKFVLWLDLQREEDALFKGMASGCQRDVRAGYKKGVEFSIGNGADLSEFHRLMVSMSTTKGIAVHDAAYYERLYGVMNESCEVALFLARLEGRVIATGMSVRYGDTAWLLYAAADREHSKLNAARTLQWEMVKWARNAGCRRYDFRGTATNDPPSPEDPGYGVYKFKAGFGPDFVRLAGYFDLPTAGPLHRLFRIGEERVLPNVYRAKVWWDERQSKVQSAWTRN